MTIGSSLADPAGFASTCPIVREVALARHGADELGIKTPRLVLRYIAERLRDSEKTNRLEGRDQLAQRFADAAEQCRLISNA